MHTAICTDADLTPDGGLIVTSSFADATGLHGMRLLKTGPTGDLEWSLARMDSAVLHSSGQFLTAAPLPDGIIVAGSVIKVDSSGVEHGVFLEKAGFLSGIEWRREYFIDLTGPNLPQVMVMDNGTVVVATAKDGGDPGNHTALLWTDSIGNILQDRMYSGAGHFYFCNLQEGESGSIYAAGRVVNDISFPPFDSAFFGGSHQGGFVMRLDASGALLWGLTIDTLLAVRDIERLENGILVLGESYNGSLPVGSAGYDLYRIDSAGTVLWKRRRIFSAGDFNPTEIALHGGGQFSMLATSSTNYGIHRFDSLGNLLWSRYGDEVDLGSLVGYHFGRLIYNPFTNGYFAVGMPPFPPPQTCPRVVSLDSLGNVFSDVILGNVYLDANDNCVQDSPEAGISPLIMRATGADTLFGITDSVGGYLIEVNPGTYLVEPLPLYPYWSPSSCATLPDTASFTLPYDTVRLDFPLHPSILCPGMVVSLTHTMLRRCMTSTYYVDYCNFGTTGDSAVIVMEMDPFMTVVASSIPWQLPQFGNTYVFEVGYLNPGDCGRLVLGAEISCDTAEVAFGQTHCVEAHIYPDSLCTPPETLWDGASIMLEGSCSPSEDSVRFVIRNVGTAITATPGNVIVLEDNLMRMNTNALLAPGDSLVIAYAANGSTWTCAAEQSPFHPGDDHPMVSIEGCGVNALGSFSTGFMNLLPLNDADPWIDIDCSQNSAAYDPNMKEAMPTGMGPLHLIQATDLLEYTVHFQNTGNDTAFRVVVRDTLSSHLDPSTILPGAASHSYTFRLIGSNIGEWTFDNILLPDSSTDGPASHGVFEFTIRQREGNAMGTHIPNGVSIWFDFNAPVPTETVLRIIGEEIWGVISVDPAQESTVKVCAWPNPSSEAIRFRMEGGNPPLTLTLSDVHGRMVQTVQDEGDELTLGRGNLPPGIYLFLLSDAKGNQGTGKLVIY